MTLEETAFALKSVGDLNGSGKKIVTGVQTDSRLVKPGDLFICLSGKRLDGHHFADQAVQNGAVAVVSHHPMSQSGAAVLLVQDTLIALGSLGRYWRIKKGKTVLAITGSAGKTTTKEMLYHILGREPSVGKNFRNWNNQIGLPLSILRFSGNEDLWILELGINTPGDMDELGAIACPDQAVILNVGPCHLQGLETIEGVARSKARLLDHLQGPKTAFICRDYPLLEKEVLSRPQIKPIWFSCHARPSHYRLQHLSGNQFQITEADLTLSFESRPGWEQYCENIGAAWAAARQWGMAPEQIIQKLLDFRLPEQRFSVSTCGSWTVVDDTYNANPMSMERAINSARSLAGKKNLLLVIGDMAELGTYETQAHHDLGREISKTGCQGLFFYGRNAETVRSALNNGQQSNFFVIHDCQSFKRALKSLNCSGGVVLFKGSRSIGMEKYVACFREWAGPGDVQPENT